MQFELTKHAIMQGQLRLGLSESHLTMWIKDLFRDEDFFMLKQKRHNKDVHYTATRNGISIGAARDGEQWVIMTIYINGHFDRMLATALRRGNRKLAVYIKRGRRP